MMNEKMKSYLQKFRSIAQFCAQKLTWLYTAILLSLVYFIVVGFMALIVRFLRKDLLQKKFSPTQASYWRTRLSSEPNLERHKFQF